MEFLDWHKAESHLAHDQMYFPRKKAVAYVQELLAPLNYDFAAAWFLALGLADDRATEPVKRAMVYMAAISATEATSQGLPAVLYKGDMHEALSSAFDTPVFGEDRGNVVEELCFKVHNCITFLSQLWAQGGIWAQLAFLHTLHTADATFVADKSELDKLVLSSSGNKAIRTLRPEMRAVMARVLSICRILELNLVRKAPLYLHEQDCSFIQSCLSLAWRHCSFLLVAPKECNILFLDLVAAASTGSGQHPGDALHVDLAFQSTDTPDGKLFLAVRHLERRNDKVLAIKDTVVLPFAVIGIPVEFYKSVRL
ncbi:hypothetical protein LMH87_002310 [Akanthomyces muscarius]|uniref:Uncharacterized protein n=1 Tax=Akanthomyces muscarius TaxID=2231603 RepID=A0A9W8Q8J2_AKAMU|nr:hypothetical protein LMH87_002310 [Akanthomyces muscarius]KAJ4147806.1 hypothetical protein LMH87_002310 [Akanthomyces muscarius]